MELGVESGIRAPNFNICWALDGPTRKPDTNEATDGVKLFPGCLVTFFRHQDLQFNSGLFYLFDERVAGFKVFSRKGMRFIY